ncbi:hypothetical protein C8Q74DRAFT_811244 [Fomes fomentarius]|nr:hypothetical protein C8Q74DRAFT_811244 [Fomes fomentarius]
MYLGGCLIWTFVPADGWAYPTSILPRTWGYRAGKLTANQLPFMVLLAMKNNPISWLTGIGHERLNLIHRGVSRCYFPFVWLHLVGMYYRAPAKLLNSGWKAAGLVGCITFNVIIFASFKGIRQRFYEMFYVSHVALSITLLVAINVHLTGHDYTSLIWGMWAIWGLDRVLRASRHIHNLITRPFKLNANVSVVSEDGLRISIRRKIWGGWRGGQHAFLAFPTLGLQSHPFTVASIFEGDGKKKEESTEAGGQAEGDDDPELIFFVRVKNGQTRKLADLARDGSYELPALIDGPYGCPEDIRPFTTCIFIAGGSGITYALSRMHQLLKDVRASNACAQRVVFVWAVRTEAEYEGLAVDLAKAASAAPKSLSLSIDVHLTNTVGGPDGVPTLEKDEDELDLEKGATVPRLSHSKRSSSSNYSEPNLKGAKGQQPSTSHSEGAAESETPELTGSESNPDLKSAQAQTGIRRRYGRPNVYKILEEEIAASRGTVAVDVSGPDELVSVVRNALCAPFVGPIAVLKGAPTVMLCVEQFRL